MEPNVVEHNCCNCCVEHPCKICSDNILKDIYNEYKLLQKRHRKLQPKKKVFVKLARPSHRRKKYKPACFKSSFQTRVVRLEKERQNTHLEQLGYVSVRKLLELKKAFKHVLCPERIYMINRNIRKSLFSYYSYLADVQPPQRPVKPVKWTEKDWKKHRKIFKFLSQPKQPIEPEEIVRQKKPINLMAANIDKLSRPKYTREVDSEKTANYKTLREKMKNYKPNQRLLALYQVKAHEDYHYKDPSAISPTALTYKASQKIKELAEHKVKPAKDSDLRENPFLISKNALKAKASKRLTELAEPKSYDDESLINPNPFNVSPAALKAKMTPRLENLAKPKQRL